jgi:hypothetical protein
LSSSLAALAFEGIMVDANPKTAQHIIWVVFFIVGSGMRQMPRV